MCACIISIYTNIKKRKHTLLRGVVYKQSQHNFEYHNEAVWEQLVTNIIMAILEL